MMLLNSSGAPYKYPATHSGFGTQFVGLQGYSNTHTTIQQTLANIPTNVSLTLELVACYRHGYSGVPITTVSLGGTVVMSTADVLKTVDVEPNWGTFTASVVCATSNPVLQLDAVHPSDATLFVSRLRLLH